MGWKDVRDLCVPLSFTDEDSGTQTGTWLAPTKHLEQRLIHGEQEERD